MPCSPTRGSRRAFTLIELLVVIAIIAILAAILFPVFQKVRENGRRTVCLSNEKQFGLGILQYVQDNEEALPVAYNQDHAYGPAVAQYNATGIGGAVGGQSGVAAQIQPYVRSQDVFLCPDDSGLDPSDAANVAPGIPPAVASSARSYRDVFGTSYKFTNQNFSHPYPTKAQTGYATALACGAAGAGKDCDYSAHVEAIDQTGSWNPGSDPGAPGIATLTLAAFARPAQTRMFADWQKTFSDKPSAKKLFHPDGCAIAYVDGHVKFVTRYSDYQSGCDGVDWAWDQAGSCNNQGLQRKQN